MTEAHSVTVAQSGGRYPFRPTCSCGWETWGYVAEHAARDMAAAHVTHVTLADPVTAATKEAVA